MGHAYQHRARQARLAHEAKVARRDGMTDALKLGWTKEQGKVVALVKWVETYQLRFRLALGIAIALGVGLIGYILKGN